MIEISMGPSKMEGPYEIAEILTNSTMVDKWLAEADELPHTLMHTIVGWYTLSPRISVEDIAGCKIEARGAKFALILKIRRGKDMIAEFLSRHRLVEIYAIAHSLSLECQCGVEIVIPWDAIGHTGGSPCQASH